MHSQSLFLKRYDLPLSRFRELTVRYDTYMDACLKMKLTFGVSFKKRKKSENTLAY